MEHKERLERMALLSIAVRAEMSRGQGDSAYADETRARMDDLYHGIDGETMSQLEGLSEDLMWVFEPDFIEEAPVSSTVTRADVRDAVIAQDWVKVLNLMRVVRHPLLSVSVRLGWMARAYRHLVSPWLGDLFRGASVRLQEER